MYTKRRNLIAAFFVLVFACGVWLGIDRSGSRQAESLVPAGTEWKNPLGMSFRWCPPGEYLRGSPEDEPGRFMTERQHHVTLTRGFWLGTYPVTQAEWVMIMETNSSWFSGSPGDDRRPAEGMSFDDILLFIERLNERDAPNRYRLPTEAEWEYACRAGTTTALYSGDITILGKNNAPELDAIAWYAGNSRSDHPSAHNSSDWKEKAHDHDKASTQPVGRKRPNPWGFHDMLGNVWEWCSDGFGEYPVGPLIDPQGADQLRRRVIRGGSWFNDARNCRSAMRRQSETIYHYVDFTTGFRIVRE